MRVSTMKKHHKLAFFLLFLLLAAPGARAKDKGGFSGMFDGGIGFGAIAEDYFVRLSVGAAFQFDDIGFGVQVPLNLRAIDNAPIQDSVIRQEDWDEYSDFFKILRYFQYGFPRDPYYVRVGELAGVSLGHGTIVSNYYNVVDVNHYKMGVRATVDVGYGGAELLLDHIAPPNIMGLRGFVRPFTFFDTAKIFKSVTTGLVFVADFHAPTTVKVDAQGVPIVDDAGLERSSSEAVLLYGWDLDWEVYSNSWVSIVPYFDLMFLEDEGVGTHLGTFVNFRLPADIRIDTRFEWRFASEGYQPTYIDSIYEIERWRFITGPKITDVRAGLAAAGSDRHGFFGSLDFHVGDYVTVGAMYEDYQGPDNANFTARLDLPYISIVKLSAFYTKRNFDDAEDLGSLDNALLVALARFKVYGPLYVYGEYARQWHIVEDGPDKGQYETVDNYGFGAGAEIRF
jgi:hypothetical protein